MATRLAILALAALALAGCISERTQLVNKDGKTVYCSASGFGWLMWSLRHGDRGDRCEEALMGDRCRPGYVPVGLKDIERLKQRHKVTPPACIIHKMSEVMASRG